MVCKFCGSTIDDNELECPYCGHKTGVVPQSVTYDETEPEGFEYQDNYSREDYVREDYSRDTYADENYSQNTEDYSEDVSDVNYRASQRDYDESDLDEEEVAEEEKPRTQKKKSKIPSIPKFNFGSGKRSGLSADKPIGPLPMLIGIGVCAVISLICLISVVSTKSAVEKLEQDMLSQFYQLQSANIELSSQVSALGGDITNVSSTISEANNSKNITITRSPTSDATYLGRGSDQDVSQNSPLFYAEASGVIKDIKWQVKENGEWVSITFDESSNNATYGVHIYNEIGQTAAKSTLGSHNITSQAFNKQYRCVFYDAFGSKATEPATLTERAQ